MIDFSTFTNSDWLSLGSLILASIAVYWSIRTDTHTKRETKSKIKSLENTLSTSFRILDYKLHLIDKKHQHLIGYLKGAQLIKEGYRNDNED